MFENSPINPATNSDDSPTGLSIDIKCGQPNPQPAPKKLENRPIPLYFLCVNYHSAALISDLMHTLEINQGIVIVNNSPADRAIHALDAKEYGGGKVTVLDASNNGGFGSGCNLGLEWIYARSPHALVWLINPDAALIPGAVASVRKCLATKPSTTILGTPILDSHGKLWFGSGQFNPWTGSVTSHRGQRTRSQRAKRAGGSVIPTRWVSGCSMILNLATLDHCPQFDEVYFLYYEDCDLCDRYFKAGYEIALTPMPLVIHAVSSITSRYVQTKFVHGTFSKLTFLKKHGTLLALGLNLLYLSARASIETFRSPLAAKGRWQGIWKFLRRSNSSSSASTYPDTLANTNLQAFQKGFPPQKAPENSTKNRNNSAGF